MLQRFSLHLFNLRTRLTNLSRQQLWLRGIAFALGLLCILLTFTRFDNTFFLAGFVFAISGLFAATLDPDRHGTTLFFVCILGAIFPAPMNVAKVIIISSICLVIHFLWAYAAALPPAVMAEEDVWKQLLGAFSVNLCLSVVFTALALLLPGLANPTLALILVCLCCVLTAGIGVTVIVQRTSKHHA